LGARQRDGGIVFRQRRCDEVGFLGAFDANRKLIYAIAAKVYGRRRKGSYDLIAADF
jgi:hypothetical protein